MNKFIKVIKTFRVVSFSASNQSIVNVYIKNYRLQIPPTHCYINIREMAQKSIMSFFKITPKKNENQLTPEKVNALSNDNLECTVSPESTGSKMRSSKRLRSESKESSPRASNNSSSPVVSDGVKKKIKRQRIESSESESESPAKFTKTSPKEMKHKINEEIKQDEFKTYQSPKSKKAKEKQMMQKESKIKEESASLETKENVLNNGKNCHSESVGTDKGKATTPKGKKRNATKNDNKNKSLCVEEQIKEENSSPDRKESILGNVNVSNLSPKQQDEKDKSPPKKKNAFEVMNSKASKKENPGDKEASNCNKTGGVAEVDYNPAKSKYNPVDDACWVTGQAVPYLALARTLELIEGTSARLKMVEILSNYLRSVIVLTPEDLLSSIYLCLNQLAPAYHSIELGIAETYLMKAVGQCTGRTLAQMRAAAQKSGDLGLVAEQARATQRTMFAPPPLTVRKVFHALKEVALMTGQASVTKKIGKIQSLYVACRHSEARYLIRSLEGKLRVGLAEQSLLQALALALASPAPGESPVTAGKADKFKSRVDKFALIIKTTYCECPNYELIVPVLLEHGVEALPEHCRLTPGIPLKPMLAHPTKGVHEVFNRFENEEFTCEYKYDGERAQIHVPAAPDGSAPDLPRAAVFSRNQENNTSKYPDILSRLPALLGESVTSCVLDCEAVAYDPATKQILPFQVLSTRKRKDASESAISVQVCVFVFDLLFLNGRALVREPLAERRRLLRDHLRETEGTWQFAKSRDCSTTEEVQQFLDEAVRGSCEGLMVKTLSGDHARYDIARRSRNWLKLKKDYLDGVGDTIDVVVIGGYWGRGKRSGAFGGFLLACYDPAAEEYQSLCKIGTGFSDDDLKTLSETLQQHVLDSPPNYYRYDNSHAPDVWFGAACVWEVRCADLSLSPAHRAAAGLAHHEKGVSLRFPRFIRVREDKTPEQATSAQQIAEMYLAQDQVKNVGTKQLAEDDFY